MNPFPVHLPYQRHVPSISGRERGEKRRKEERGEMPVRSLPRRTSGRPSQARTCPPPSCGFEKGERGKRRKKKREKKGKEDQSRDRISTIRCRASFPYCDLVPSCQSVRRPKGGRGGGGGEKKREGRGDEQIVTAFDRDAITLSHSHHCSDELCCSGREVVWSWRSDAGAKGRKKRERKEREGKR